MKTSMNSGRKLISALAVAVAMAWACGASAANLQLAQGSSQKVDVPNGVKKITVSNPSIVDATPGADGKSITVSAIGDGSSEIRIEQQSGADMVVMVRTLADIKGMADEIKQLLADVEGLNVKQIGNKIVLDGKLITKASFDRVQQVADAYSGLVLNLAKLDRGELNEYVAKAIMNDISMDSVKVRVSGDTATLEGEVYDQADMQRAVEVTKLRVANVVNLLALREIMIETDVQFVQVTTSASKDYGMNVLKTLGVDASASLSGGSGQGSPVSSFTVGGSISARINALVGQGNAKIVAQPHISTKSGGSGRFLSGGEIYAKVTGINAGSLQKIEYGVILTVKPVLRGKSGILNEVTIEVSVPTASSSGDYSFDKFETSSTTLCKEGDSIIISGLAQSLQSHFKEKTPLLGSIPVLNLFFSESSKKTDNKDLVVVLTPRRGGAEASKTATPASEDRKPLLNEVNK